MNPETRMKMGGAVRAVAQRVGDKMRGMTKADHDAIARAKAKRERKGAKLWRDHARSAMKGR